MCTPLRAYGTLGTPSDPTVCISDCRTRFIQKVTAPTDLHALCAALDGNSGTLTDFYCCDSVLCGVSNSQAGQDPNVQWIIASCQNLGFTNINDPGPPADSCPADTLYAPTETPCSLLTSQSTSSSPTALPSTSTNASASTLFAAHVKPTKSPILGNSTVASMSTSRVNALDIFGTASITLALSSITSTTSPSVASVSSQSSMSPLNLATSSPLLPSPPTSTSSSAADALSASSSSSSSSGMPTSIRAVIAVCSILALLTLALLFSFLFRRRHRRRRPHLSRNHGPSVPSTSSSSSKPPLLFRQRTLSSPPASPTHLITPPRPISSATNRISPLTPPLRLRDRQLLPTPPRTMETAPAGQGPFGAHVMADGFPTSPICAPTVNRLEPRHEKFSRLDNSSASSLGPKGPRTKRDSANSITSGSSSHYSSHSINSLVPLSDFTGVNGLSIAPTRPPRPDVLLEIPEFVRPGPGSAKLHPRSASSPIVPKGDPPPVVPPMHPGRALSAKGSRAELKTKARTRTVFAEPGIALSTPEEEQRVMLQEGDIEQMSGQYH